MMDRWGLEKKDLRPKNSGTGKKEVYSVRITETPHGRIISVCDIELLGKKFVEKDVILDISREYYQGEPMEESEIVNLANESQMISFVGRRSVSLAIKHKLIHPQAVLKVKGTPYAMFIKTTL